MENGNPLHRVRIVLVEPTHPGNVGAAARAMKTMGLDRLALVAPRRFPSAEATARAAGADDVLHAARVVGSLDDALADCGYVLGTTARPRRIEWPVLDAREGARRAVAQAARTPVSVVFGRESAGLANDELDRCHALVRIPVAARFSSLNVAAAVQILAYEMRIAAYGDGAGAHGGNAGGRDEEARAPGREAGPRGEGAGMRGDDAGEGRPQQPPAATAGELEGFYRHLEAALVGIGYLDPAAPRFLMRRLRRLFNRAGPDRTEIGILRGILNAVMRDGRGGGGPSPGPSGPVRLRRGGAGGEDASG